VPYTALQYNSSLKSWLPQHGNSCGRSTVCTGRWVFNDGSTLRPGHGRQTGDRCTGKGWRLELHAQQRSGRHCGGRRRLRRQCEALYRCALEAREPPSLVRRKPHVDGALERSERRQTRGSRLGCTAKSASGESPARARQRAPLARAGGEYWSAQTRHHTVCTHTASLQRAPLARAGGGYRSSQTRHHTVCTHTASRQRAPLARAGGGYRSSQTRPHTGCTHTASRQRAGIARGRGGRWSVRMRYRTGCTHTASRQRARIARGRGGSWSAQTRPHTERTHTASRPSARLARACGGRRSV